MAGGATNATVMAAKSWRSRFHPSRAESSQCSWRSRTPFGVQEVKVDCYTPGKSRIVYQNQNGVFQRLKFNNEGMDFNLSNPVARPINPDIGDPKIPVTALWKIALTKGADSKAVAFIDDDKTGYEFKIEGSKVYFLCDAAGKELP